MLLKAGADVDKAETGSGCTSLLPAARFGHSAVVEMLLKAGGNPNFTDYAGDSALRVSVTNEHREVALLLAEYGACSDDGVLSPSQLQKLHKWVVVEMKNAKQCAKEKDADIERLMQGIPEKCVEKATSSETQKKNGGIGEAAVILSVSAEA
jgi:ankyrin repeat protein